MVRRRCGEITSENEISYQGRRITMAQPISSILGNIVKNNRSIAHNNTFEGYKL